MVREQPETVWVVVLVKSGIPADVEVFRDLRSAQMREEFFRADINLNNDETNVIKLRERMCHCERSEAISRLHTQATIGIASSLRSSQ